MTTGGRLRPTIKTKLKRLAIAAGCCIAIYCLAAAALTIYGVTDSISAEDVEADGPSDVIVVLGNEVLPSGKPSNRLRARLDAAFAAFDHEFAGHVIVSGGVGASGFDEAVVMADYLEEQGVPKSSITIDSEGITTRATAINTAKIMEDRGWDSAIVVSQFYHVPRGRLALGQEGVEEVSTIHADYLETRDMYSLAREVPAFAKYLLG